MADDNLQTSKNIWFIFGPSGSGKTHFSKFISEKNNWLHLELDQFPIGDGIALFGLRNEWDLFYQQGITTGLISKIEMLYRAKGFSGAVLSFPSRYVLAKEQIEQIESFVKVIYLHGKKNFCLNAFLIRERETGRNLSAIYWKMNNDLPYMLISDSSLKPYRINVFTQAGSYKGVVEILDEIQSRKN